MEIVIQQVVESERDEDQICEHMKVTLGIQQIKIQI